MVIKHLKGGDAAPSRTASGPGAAERAERLEFEAARIVGRATEAERRQRETVAGITDVAMRRSVQEQRRKLVG
jgi:hypothetical protein